MTPSPDLSTELFSSKPFLVGGSLTSQDKSYSIQILVDTGATGYAFIDRSLVSEICELLEINPIRLAKPKKLRGYDGQIAKKPITEALYPNLVLPGHKELTAPMLITDLGQHAAILGKPWMNRFGVLLDMSNDTIIFPNQLPKTNPKPILSINPESKSPLETRVVEPSTSKAPKILPRLKPPQEDEQYTIHSVGAEAFGLLARGARRNKTEIFALSMEDIDNQLAFHREAQLDVISLSSVEAASQNLEEIKAKLPSEYHEFLDVFDRAQADKLPPHRSYDHKIELSGDRPPPQSGAYRMSPYKLQKVKEYLNENLSKGFITPSKAPYSSPVLFALKSNGDLRFCVDYRKLNAMTKRNRYPLPLIEEVIGKILGCKHLTRLDIIAAFNKLRMHPDSEDFTTFITALGAYKYKVLPFGLTNGPSSFQQYINETLWDFLDDFVQAYLDDILIYSKTKKEHRRHVALVLQRLREAGLQVDIKKCEFDVEETVFLGVIISSTGLRMDPKKVEAILKWATPECLKDVQGFVGFVNFYRRFIFEFSKLAKPLVLLTKKDAPFVWNEACGKAFEALKKQVSTAPVLRHFNPSKQSILETDSSDYVTGGVLSQYDDEGVLHPVAFYSKSMVPAECNYHIYDKELLVIIRCLEHWRPELECTELPIQIFTDHQALKTFMENKELTRRQARYLDILSEFNFQIIFRPGKKNGKADALTRMPDSRPKDSSDERSQFQHQTILTPDRVQINTMSIEAGLFERILIANKTDEGCEQYRQAVAKGDRKLNGIKLEQCRIVDGALYKRGLLWVPDQFHTELMQEVHDQPSSGHPGIKRTIDLIRRHYYWPNLGETVRRYTSNCHDCRRTKAPRDKINGLLVPLPIPQQRWKDIGMDFITGLPLSESFNCICTVICRLSKERHYVPCHWGDEGTSSEEVVWILLWNVYRLHGLPCSITSDRDPRFISTLWKSLCKRLKIKANLSTAFHPQTDGQTERANQDIERGLRTYCNYMQDDWAKWIPMMEFSDNNNTASATSMTPFYFNKGFHPRMSFDPDCTDYETTRERLQADKADNIATKMQELLKYGHQRLKKSREAMSTQANKHRKEVAYDVGDYVWLSSKNIQTDRPCKDLEDKQLGPYEIIEKMGASYRLKLPKSFRSHNVFGPNSLRPVANDPLPDQRQEPPKPVVTPEGEEWELDDILKSRYYYGRLQYQVKWDGEGKDRDWYYADASEFKNAQEVVQDYHKRYPNSPGPDPMKPRNRLRSTRHSLSVKSLQLSG